MWLRFSSTFKGKRHTLAAKVNSLFLENVVLLLAFHRPSNWHHARLHHSRTLLICSPFTLLKFLARVRKPWLQESKSSLACCDTSSRNPAPPLERGGNSRDFVHWTGSCADAATKIPRIIILRKRVSYFTAKTQPRFLWKIWFCDTYREYFYREYLYNSLKYEFNSFNSIYFLCSSCRNKKISFADL